MVKSIHYMENPADYIYADRILKDMRFEVLQIAFERDIFAPKGFLPLEAIKGDILDLGCGKGGVGEILKSKNPEINLTGVDIYDYPERDPETYSHFFQRRAYDFLKEAEEKGRQYDLVISVGMPPDEVERIMREIDPDKILKPGGYIVLAVDSQLKERKGKFQIRESKYPIIANIAYYSRPPELNPTPSNF